MATLDKRALSGAKEYLIQQGVSLPKRANETVICQALFRFLVAHRGDRRIWHGLTVAIEQTGCNRLRLCCKNGREDSLSALLGKLSHLRAALPTRESPQGYRNFRRQLGTGVLAVFLMAAMTATGCYDADNDDEITETDNIGNINTDADETESMDPDSVETDSDAVSEGADDIETETDTITTNDDTDEIETKSDVISTDNDCESSDAIPSDLDTETNCYDETTTCRESEPLQSTVAHACIESNNKSMLCDIFDMLDDDWEQGLSAIFENGSTQDIADALDHLAICAEYTEWVFEGKYDETTAKAIKEKQLCEEMIPIYLIAAIPTLKAK